MRIDEITALKVDGSWRNWVFVRVVTDTGEVQRGHDAASDTCRG